MITVNHHANLTRTLRFAVSGAVSVGVYYVVLYFLTEHLEVWYLASSIGAFVLYWITNFGLHKYWTFNDRDKDKAKSQAGLHFMMTLGFLVLNTIGLYILVEKVRLWYITAQAIMTITLSVTSYFLMHKIFRAA
jgi:putative flippase GtrA